MTKSDSKINNHISENFLGKLSLALTAVIAIVALLMLGQESLRLQYDASNTLNIAGFSVREILQILYFEQNFPLYYILFHFLLQHTHETVAILLLNYLPWLASLFLMYRTFPHATLSERRIFAFLFAGAGATFFYAYYPRPYSMLLLAVCLQTYVLLNKESIHPRVAMVIECLAVCFAVSLHPVGVCVLGIMILHLVFEKRNTVETRTWIRWCVSLTAFFLWLLFLVTKEDGFGNFQRGLSYIQNQFKGDPLTSAFFLNAGPNSFIFELTVLSLVGYAASRCKLKSPKELSLLLLLLPPIACVLVAMVRTVNAHHFAALLAQAIVLAAFVCFKSIAKEARVMGLLILLVVVLSNTIATVDESRSEIDALKAFCEASERIKADLPIITDYTALNVLQTCKKRSVPSITPIFIADETGLSEVSHQKTLDTVLMQARKGGFASLSMQQTLHVRLRGKQFSQLTGFSAAQNSLLPYKRIALHIYPNNLPSPSELGLMRDLGFAAFESAPLPGIYIFSRLGFNL